MAADGQSKSPGDPLDGLVEKLEAEPDLDARQKHFMRARWLDQVVWLDGKAKHCQQRYYVLRLVGIVGGLSVPALISLDEFRVASIVVSLLVAIAVSVEGFFRYGERWRHYRRTAEVLKGQGWEFYGLAGAYAAYDSHAAAFRPFATAVEGVIAEDVEVYVKQVTREQQQEGQAGSEPEPETEGRARVTAVAGEQPDHPDARMAGLSSTFVRQPSKARDRR